MPPERMEELFREIVGNAGNEIKLMESLASLRKEIPAPPTAENNSEDWKAKYEAAKGENDTLKESYRNAFYESIKPKDTTEDHQPDPNEPLSFDALFERR